ncbi:hypothetical protein ACXYRQ_03660 [Mycoplasma sp. 394]
MRDIEQLKQLCNKIDESTYESKIGVDYINALKNLFSLKTKMTPPFISRCHNST